MSTAGFLFPPGACAYCSRAVAQGPFVFVSGTTGFDYATMTIPEDTAAQAERCLANVAAALAEQGHVAPGGKPYGAGSIAAMLRAVA